MELFYSGKLKDRRIKNLSFVNIAIKRIRSEARTIKIETSRLAEEAR